MKIKQITAGVLLSAVFPTAMAGDFDGPFVQIGAGVANSQTAVDSYWKLPPNVDAKPDKRNFVGQLAAGYSKSFGNLNLAASVFYVLGDQKSGETRADGGASGGERYVFRNEQTWGVSIEPGYYLNKSSLLYARLGYVQTRGKTKNDFQGSTYHFNTTYQGFHYGAGARFALSDKLYGLVEIQKLQYRREYFNEGSDGGISMKPESLIGLIGIGYKFQR